MHQAVHQHSKVIVLMCKLPLYTLPATRAALDQPSLTCMSPAMIWDRSLCLSRRASVTPGQLRACLYKQLLVLLSQGHNSMLAMRGPLL